MNLKLTNSEFFSLYLLMEKCIAGSCPKGIEAIAIHGVLKGLYKKFYVRAFDIKKKYAVTLEDHEACAFYMFFSRYPMKDENTFSVNLVIQLNISIHQKFAV
jgi:hypothetical protein